MLNSVCIAVNDQMLAAALAVPVAGRIFSADETMRIRQNRYQAGDTPYPAWYLFGCAHKGVAGLVAQYAKICSDVYLCPESMITPALPADLIDVQFSTLRGRDVQTFKRQGKLISGYLPEPLSLKSVQAQQLRKLGGNRFLPIQKNYSWGSEAVLPESAGTILIMKETSGSAGRGKNGRPYTVWLRDNLESQLKNIIERLGPDQEILISEFIFTDDPFAWHADHVVHKMHYITDKAENYVVPYGSVCQKFIYRCNRQRLRETGMLSLGEFVGEPYITTGVIDSINSIGEFNNLIAAYTGCLMLSVDFIVPSDGIPRFLEVNKLAATFAERFDPQLPAPVDTYAALHV